MQSNESKVADCVTNKNEVWSRKIVAIALCGRKISQLSKDRLGQSVMECVFLLS